MASKPYRWTVDVEYDFGGRTDGINGLLEGLPRIYKAFAEKKIKALFFISTETLARLPSLVKEIQSLGHEVGSHGHFHIRFKEKWRAQKDLELSKKLLGSSLGLYRAPKFYWNRENNIYANPEGHVSLLKHMWLRQSIKEESILYLHPFDIVRASEPAPNLFCRLWYSRPDWAYQTFLKLVNRYK